MLSPPACCDAAGVALFTGPRPRDVRAPDHYVSKLVGHKSEVCGLKWSYDDRELASGRGGVLAALLPSHLDLSTSE